MTTALDLATSVAYAWLAYDAFCTGNRFGRWVWAPCCAYISVVFVLRVVS